jgi:hypothetical protein
MKIRQVREECITVRVLGLHFPPPPIIKAATLKQPSPTTPVYLSLGGENGLETKSWKYVSNPMYSFSSGSTPVFSHAMRTIVNTVQYSTNTYNKIWQVNVLW